MQTRYKTTASVTVDHRKGQEPDLAELAKTLEFCISLELATEDSENKVGKAEVTGVAIDWDLVHKDETKPLCTVNCIEIGDTNTHVVDYMASFMDTEEGNTEAERIFRTKVAAKSPEISDEDMDSHIEDGYFEQGAYYICLVHSTLAPNEG